MSLRLVLWVYGCLAVQLCLAADVLSPLLLVVVVAQWLVLMTWWGVPPFDQLRRRGER